MNPKITEQECIKELRWKILIDSAVIKSIKAEHIGTEDIVQNQPNHDKESYLNEMF